MLKRRVAVTVVLLLSMSGCTWHYTKIKAPPDTPVVVKTVYGHAP